MHQLSIKPRMILDNDIPKLDTDMIIAGSRYKHSEARELTNVARDKMEKKEGDH